MLLLLWLASWHAASLNNRQLSLPCVGIFPDLTCPSTTCLQVPNGRT